VNFDVAVTEMYPRIS